ncbi:hypothetical protein ACKWTF_009403 [Chironomus riparius]
MLSNLIIFTTIFAIRTADSSLPCKFIETVNITDGFKDSNDNFIYKSEIFPLGTYDEFDYIEDYSYVKISANPHIRGCVCKQKQCLRFCCLENDTENCLQSNELNVFNEDNEEETIDISDNKYSILLGRSCKDMYELERDAGEEWKLLNNGSLLLDDNVFDHNEFCVEKNDDSNAIVYVCFPEQEQDFSDIIHSIGFFISIPFLIITFLIYASIPELRNLHGKCLMCYTFSLTVFYSLMLKLNIFKHLELRNGIMTAVLIYFTIFLSFFWVNIMCYDIWRIARNGIAKRSQVEGQKMFIIYCIYAIGIPLLMTITAVLINHHQLFHHEYLPMFGENDWMHHELKAQAIYLYIPIGIIIIINIMLFLDTARKIWQVQSTMSDESSTKGHGILRRRFSVYLRLFIIMGLMWSMELISFVYQKIHILFYITDFFNCAQGFVIFLVCVCDKRTRKLFRKRFFASTTTKDESLTSAIGTYDETLKMTALKI